MLENTGQLIKITDNYN